MAKRVELIDPSKSRVKEQNFDWNLCCLCQEILKKNCNVRLVNHRRGTKHLLKNVAGFVELGLYPMPLDLSKLDEGCCIAQTLENHRGSWHKSCNMKFKTTMLERERKRKVSGSAEHSATLEGPRKYTTTKRKLRRFCVW